MAGDQEIKRLGPIPKGWKPPTPMGPPSPSPRQHMQDTAQGYGVDPSLMNRVIQQESGWNPGAVSPKGAIGLTQLMPQTAQRQGVDPYAPLQNIEGGEKELGQLLQQYGGDVNKALAAYNAGSKAVDTYGGVPPYKETQNYVQNITQGYSPIKRVGDIPPGWKPDRSFLQKAFGEFMGSGQKRPPAKPVQPTEGYLKDVGQFDRSAIQMATGADPNAPPKPGLIGGVTDIAKGMTSPPSGAMGSAAGEVPGPGFSLGTPQQMIQPYKEAGQAAMQGQFGKAAERAVEGTPIVGGAIEDVANRIRNKDYAGAISSGLGNILLMGGGEELLRRLGGGPGVKAAGEPKPVEPSKPPSGKDVVKGPSSVSPPTPEKPSDIAQFALDQLKSGRGKMTKDLLGFIKKDTGLNLGNLGKEGRIKALSDYIQHRQDVQDIQTGKIKSPPSGKPKAEAAAPILEEGKKRLSAEEQSKQDFQKEMFSKLKKPEPVAPTQTFKPSVGQEPIEVAPPTKAKELPREGEPVQTPPKTPVEGLQKPVEPTKAAPKGTPLDQLTERVTSLPGADKEHISNIRSTVESAKLPVKSRYNTTLSALQAYGAALRKGFKSQDAQIEAFKIIRRAEKMGESLENQRGSISFKPRQKPDTIEAQEPGTKDFLNSLRLFKDPSASLGKETMHQELRAGLGEEARKNAVAQDKLSSARQKWQKRSPAEFMAFADMAEGGEKSRMDRGVKLDPALQAKLDAGKAKLTPEDQVLAQQLKQMTDVGWSQIKKTKSGATPQFVENYFARQWQKPGVIKSAVQMMRQRRPMEGGKTVMKERSIPTAIEGFAKGLKPITYNPIDMTLTKLHEMNKYVMAHHMLDEAKGRGLAKLVRKQSDIPQGWVRVNDPMFSVWQRNPTEKAFMKRGEYYMPKGAAQVMDRYLQTGLRGNAIYRDVRNIANALNQAQLGLSGYHAGMTAINAVTSQMALGLKQMLSPEGWSKERAWSGAKKLASSPIAPYRYYKMGSKGIQEYLKPDSFKQLSKDIDMATRGGMRVEMDKEYGRDAIASMRRSIREGNWAAAGLKSVPALLEATAWPVMQKMVPHIKVGAMMDMAHDVMERSVKEGWDKDRTTKAMQKAWDSVDNRFGEVVYDNLNWNKTLKDLAHVGVRSVGWTFGTWRELGGAVKDIGEQSIKAAKGKGFEVTDRMAYAFALPITVGLIGTLYNYMHTGEWPKDSKDRFFPRNGRTDAKGLQERVQLPSYMRDVFSFPHDPVSYWKNKVNPLVSVTADALTNKDFYGKPIRHIDNSMIKNLADTVKYIGQQFEPIAFRNIGAQGAGQVSEPAGEVELGVSPAPKYTERSPEEQKSLDEYLERKAEGTANQRSRPGAPRPPRRR